MTNSAISRDPALFRVTAQDGMRQPLNIQGNQVGSEV